MFWPTHSRWGWDWDPWAELRRLQRDFTRLFEGVERGAPVDFPAVNVWTGPDDVIVTAEVPGIEPKNLDVSVQGDTLTIRGNREPDKIKDGESYHRQERGYGQFVRTLTLPHQVDSDKVEAKYEKGVLRLRLPRAASDKPRQIAVTTG
ncbi:MAG TPA: Hsp20/alpha crystallin family protein [Candidatus Brocadiia bacterium]|nr:Hsp20/alpha crystallin family protein [Candidatus Brocadiia bacterium]